MTRRTVIVVMANGCEWNHPVGVCMTTKAADRLIKDVTEFLNGCPKVDYSDDDWEAQKAKADKYLRLRPWGINASGADDFTKVRVPVRWVK